MLTKQDKEQLRGTIFSHLDGLATATTAYALHKKGVLEYLLKNKKTSLKELNSQFKTNEGYLNVALRILCSQGWLVQHMDNKSDAVSYEINGNTQEAFKLIPLYEDPVKLLSYSVKFPEERIGSDAYIALERIFKKHINNFGLTENTAIEQQILKHIEGCIVAPIIVLLGVRGLFHKYFMEASFRAEEYHNNPESFKKILDFFFAPYFFHNKSFNNQYDVNIRLI